MKLPLRYQFLYNEPAPRHLLKALELYGVQEIPGNVHNPVILSWAKETKLNHVYKVDEMPWCGLYMAVVMQRAERPFVKDPLWARNWSQWGIRMSQAMLGDVLVFRRGTVSGHVAIYVGEDLTHYHVLGGNQGNGVSILRMAKSRLISVQRPPYMNQPANVRVIRMAGVGVVSGDES
jgi:uncharacterized protein (TIGR02594 family)